MDSPRQYNNDIENESIEATDEPLSNHPNRFQCAGNVSDPLSRDHDFMLAYLGAAVKSSLTFRILQTMRNTD